MIFQLDSRSFYVSLAVSDKRHNNFRHFFLTLPKMYRTKVLKITVFLWGVRYTERLRISTQPSYRHSLIYIDATNITVNFHSRWCGALRNPQHTAIRITSLAQYGWVVTRAQETCTRNFHRIESITIRCKFLVLETFKHSRPISNRIILVTFISARFWQKFLYTLLQHVSPRHLNYTA